MIEIILRAIKKLVDKWTKYGTLKMQIIRIFFIFSVIINFALATLYGLFSFHTLSLRFYFYNI